MTVRFGGLHGGRLDPEDGRMLQKLVAKREEDDENHGVIPDAFADFLKRDRPLTFKQRAWVRGVYEKVFDEPMYENLASSGKLCRGREVATPEVLRPENLPKKPPTRRPIDE